METTYNPLSDQSLMRMLAHLIGVKGYSMYGDEMPIDKMIFYLSFDAKFAPPSVIKREIASAKERGLVDVSERAFVSLTSKGKDVIHEHDIRDGLNFKFRKALELETRAKTLELEGKDGKGMMGLASDLRRQVDREGMFWFPDEWKNVPVQVVKPPEIQNRPPPKKQSVVHSSHDIENRVVRKPRMVKKVD